MQNPGAFQMFFTWMGPYKWAMILLALLVIVLIARKGRDLYFVKNRSPKQIRQGIDAILFWGAFTLLVGIFSQFAGFWVAMQDILAADDISPAMITIGYLGSFASTVFGTGVLIMAGLFWWIFRHRAGYLAGLKAE